MLVVPLVVGLFLAVLRDFRFQLGLYHGFIGLNKVVDCILSDELQYASLFFLQLILGKGSVSVVFVVALNTLDTQFLGDLYLQIGSNVVVVEV